MRFDMDNLNPATWFDDEDGGRICLRILSGADLEEIYKKTTKPGVEYKHNQRFTFDDTDKEKERNLITDKMIVDWEGMFDKDGKEIECTTENKIKLTNGSPSFSIFVNECYRKLSKALEIEKEEEQKN